MIDKADAKTRRLVRAACCLLSIFFCLWSIAPQEACANNVDISTAQLVDRHTTNDTIDIKFTIGWENSWYTTGAPSATANWDAAWVFAKYSVKSGETWGDWAHCTLATSGHSAASGATIDGGLTGATPVGVFIRRSSAGQGTVSFAHNELRWNYGADFVADDAEIKVQLFAIEMVHIPEGSFYVGDTDGTATGTLKWQDGTSGAPQITASLSAAINCANTSYDDTQLEGAGIRIDGDGGLDTDADGVIDNADFPTGYKAFYLMKYEISQGQYASFLNNLIAAQATTRYPGAEGNDRHVITKVGDTYGCDANGNDVLNEPTDGEWVACNYLTWMDLCAYFDWAGLRPMSELEFEKACRGGQSAVNDEYADGTTSETVTSTLESDYENDETPTTAGCHFNYNSCVPNGPFRSGCFGIGTNTRAATGAGYYGAMELSGNIWERCVSLGGDKDASIKARDEFTGSHGDGELSNGGHGTNSDWPGESSGTITGAAGSGFRGGSWLYDIFVARVADRGLASYPSAIRRSYGEGGRGARTSP